MTVPTHADKRVDIDVAAATTGASVLRGGMWFLAGGLLPQAFTLILSVAAARFLGPDAMGRQSFIAFVVLSTTAVVGGGLATAVMRSVAEALGAGRRAEARGLVRWAQRIRFGAAVAGGAGVLALAIASSDLRLAWTLAAAATTLGILQMIPNAVLLAAQRFRESAAVGLVTGGAAVPVTIIVLALGGGIAGMFAVEAVIVAANLVWTSLLSRRALDEVAPVPELEDAAMRRSAKRYALYATAGGMLTIVVWRRSEFFFLAGYSSDAELALYSIAFAAATVLMTVTDKLAGAMSPALATLHGAGEADRLRSGHKRTLRLLFLLGLPLLALAAGGGPAAIRVVYGEEYAGAGSVLLVLLLALPFMPLWSLSVSLLAAVGDARSPLLAAAAAAVLNVALAIALVPRLDAVGAAIASVCAQALATLLLARSARRRIGRSTSGVSAGPLGCAIAVSAVAGATTWAIADGLGGPAGLAIGLVAGLALLWAGFATLRPLAAEDARWLDEQVGDRLGGRVGALARRFGR